MYKKNEPRIDRENLLTTLSVWDSYLKKKVHLIAYGGTALTLIDLKESTKDIDFIVPEEKNKKNFEHFLKILKK